MYQVNSNQFAALADFYSSDLYIDNGGDALNQPPFLVIVAERLIALEESLTAGAIALLGETILLVDDWFGTQIAAIEGIPLSPTVEFRELNAEQANVMDTIGTGIFNLMNMEPADIIHYRDIESGRQEDHIHDWVLGLLVQEECADSKSFIGEEAYESCEKAFLSYRKAINLSDLDIQSIYNHGRQIVPILSLNKAFG